MRQEHLKISFGIFYQRGFDKSDIERSAAQFSFNDAELKVIFDLRAKEVRLISTPIINGESLNRT